MSCARSFSCVRSFDVNTRSNSHRRRTVSSSPAVDQLAVDGLTVTLLETEVNVISSVFFFPHPQLHPHTGTETQACTPMTFPSSRHVLCSAEVRQDTGGHVTTVDAFVVIVPARVD